MSRQPGRPHLLTLDDVADAVIDVGFEDFTVGKVAARLKVDYTTLYRYAPQRDGLVALGLDRLLRRDGLVFYDGDAKADVRLGWQPLLTRAVRRVWGFLERHPGVATEMTRGIYPVRVFELAIELGVALVQRGFDTDDATLAIDLVLDLAVNMRRGVESLDASSSRKERSRRKSLAERARATAPSSSPRHDDVRRSFARMIEAAPEHLLEQQLAVALTGIEHWVASRTSKMPSP
jgi:hypothetical protein